MRAWVYAAVCGVLGAAVPRVGAQATLAAVQLDRSPLAQDGQLVLRPADADLAELSLRVVQVLELRSPGAVAVGEAPPPGLPEAVPAGHVALVRRGDQLQLVMGLAGGGSMEATVQLGAGAAGAMADARAVALAVEALQDAAREAPADHDAPGDAAAPVAPALAEPSTLEGFEALAVPGATLRDTTSGRATGAAPDAQAGIQPLVHARSFMGVSPATTGAVLALATAVGLCAVGYCLVIQGEFPVNGDNTSAHDVRYRYLTFGTGLRAQPLRFGRLLPAANLLLVTRLGHFGQDMGMATAPASGVQTDLGARASLELGVELFRRFDALVEAGADLAIDGWQLSAAGSTVQRGERVAPWLQAGVRYRPY